MSLNVERPAIALRGTGPCEIAWQAGVLAGAAEAGLDLRCVDTPAEVARASTPEIARRAIAEAMLPLLSLGWSPPPTRPRLAGDAVTVLRPSPRARAAMAAELTSIEAARAVVAAGRAQGREVARELTARVRTAA